jgi:hypothetical protein
VISQVSTRFTRLGRERFWLGLNLRRVDQHAVRRAFYTLVLDRLVKYVVAAALAAVVAAIGFAPAVGAAVFGGTVGIALIITTLGAWFSPAANALGGLLRGPVHDTVETLNAALPALDKLSPDPGYEARTGYMHLIRTDLQRVIDVVAPDPTRPLVVFIDDLDRCNPSTVMQTLEAINLFLAGELRNCVFVLGIEPAMLASHIEARHGALLKTLREREPLLATEDLSWRFLEKLLQLSVRLPEPPADVIGTYIGTLLEADVPGEVATAGPAPADEQERERPTDAPERAVRPRGDRDAEPADGFVDRSSDSEEVHEASLTGPRRRLDEEPLQSGPIAPEIARQARRARARIAVERKLRLDDPRVRTILAELRQRLRSTATPVLSSVWSTSSSS